MFGRWSAANDVARKMFVETLENGLEDGTRLTI
jgi:hypothetical protein